MDLGMSVLLSALASYYPPLQVRAAEALSKLVSELKEYVILNDFSTINTTITRRSEELQRRQQQAMEEAQRQYDTYKQCQLLAMKHSSAS